MPRSLEKDDKFYVVASDVNNGKQFAYVVNFTQTDNLMQIMREHPHAATTTIFTDKDEAHNTAEAYNDVFRANGTFGYQDSKTSEWHVYDNQKGEMLHGDEALSKVVDDAVRAVHTPDTINPAKLDLSSNDVVAKGYWGPNRSVAWSVTQDGTLYLNGKHITGEGHTPPWAAYDIKRCVINCETIDSCAFQGGRLKADSLEVHAKGIGAGAFSYNSAIKNLDVRADNIADSAFTGCDKLKSANIYCNGQMQPFALANNPALEFVNVSGDIDTLQDGTFNGCANLKCVTVEGNTQISNHALPDGVKVATSNDKQLGDDTRAPKTTNVRQRAGEHHEATKRKRAAEHVR